jgi:hypothetical protein
VDAGREIDSVPDPDMGMDHSVLDSDPSARTHDVVPPVTSLTWYMSSTPAGVVLCGLSHDSTIGSVASTCDAAAGSIREGGGYVVDGGCTSYE